MHLACSHVGVHRCSHLNPNGLRYLTGEPGNNLARHYLSSPQFGQSTQMLGPSLGLGGQSGGLNPLYQIGGQRSAQLALKLFYILRDGTVYHEKGGNYFDQLNPERTKRKLMARLERMGSDVVLRNSTPDTAPSPPAPLQAAAVAVPVNASNVEFTVNTGSNKSLFSKDWPVMRVTPT